MIITYFGIILFELIEWVKFIKQKPPDIQKRFGVAYERLRSRHEVSMKPGRMNAR